jgi:plastocyanin
VFLWLALLELAFAQPTGTIRGSVTMPAAARAWTWAWIDGAGPLPSTPATVQMAQRGIAFDPPVLVIPRGTIVDFPNLGPEVHNVYWITPQSTDGLGTYRAGETRSRAFDAVGVYPIGCNRHPNMSAVIQVVPNSWVVKVDREGRFELTGIPPGTWHVVVWSPRENSSVERDVVVHDGRVSELTAKFVE